MNGAQEFPGPGDPDGTANGSLTIDSSTNAISWDITYYRIATPLTGFHIHPGMAGTSGSVLVSLGTTTTGGAGTLVGSTTTTATNIANILANPIGFYVNIHNGPFSGGAVRSQLPKVFNVQLVGSEEVPGPGDPDGLAVGTLSLNPGPLRVDWNLVYTNIAAPTQFHIHDGGIGEVNPPFISLGVSTTGGSGTLIGTMTIPAFAVNGMLANPEIHHLNIHTAEFPDGAVRNQLKRIGDLDDDGDTDGFDLALLLGVWTGSRGYESCPPPIAADLDEDCKIDGFDLATLLAAWQ
jgi:hypothetical protein